MEKTIPKNIENYTFISPDKLSSRVPTEKEKEVISCFIKKYNKKNKKDMFITLSIGLFIVFLTVYNGILYDFQSVCGMFLGSAILFFITFLISRKILPPVSSCQYIQTGQLHGVWSLRNTNSHNRMCYFDVIFSDNFTRIKDVNCIPSEYSAAKPNDLILTFSYDGKSAYGCIYK